MHKTANRPAKDAVLDCLAGQEILAPAHQLAEVSSALIHLLRAGELPETEARRALADAASLVQRTVLIDAPLLARAFELRDRVRISGGLYVATAQHHDCPLVTTDGRLAHADPPCTVIVPSP